MTGAATGRGRSLPRAAAWLTLLLAGQAATLAAILAGPSSRYQHVVAPERSLAQFPLAPLAVLVADLPEVTGSATRCLLDGCRREPVRLTG